MDHETLELMDHSGSKVQVVSKAFVLTLCLIVFDDRYHNTPPFRDAWMPVGMASDSAFYQVLSNAALNIAALRANGTAPETKEAMMHHTKAVSLVARKVSHVNTATSDGVIGSIIGFACYSVKPPIFRNRKTC